MWKWVSVLLLFPIAVLGASRGSKISPAERDSLLHTREDAWRALFANDSNRIAQYFPAETLGINAGEESWADFKAVKAGSQAFVNSGSKLVRLEFPRTEIQRYGDVYIIYSLYTLETEQGGKHSVLSGRVTEVFVKRNGKWINPGWHMDSGK